MLPTVRTCGNNLLLSLATTRGHPLVYGCPKSVAICPAFSFFYTLITFLPDNVSGFPERAGFVVVQFTTLQFSLGFCINFHLEAMVVFGINI
jgi:hypothetical protein